MQLRHPFHGKALHFAQLRDYIAQDSPFYARQFTERLVLAVERLATLPRSGRTVPEAGHQDAIREVLYQAADAGPGRLRGKAAGEVFHLSAQGVFVGFQGAHQAVSLEPAGELEHAADLAPAELQGAVELIGLTGQQPRAPGGDGHHELGDGGVGQGDSDREGSHVLFSGGWGLARSGPPSTGELRHISPEGERSGLQGT